MAIDWQLATYNLSADVARLEAERDAALRERDDARAGFKVLEGVVADLAAVRELAEGRELKALRERDEARGVANEAVRIATDGDYRRTGRERLQRLADPYDWMRFPCLADPYDWMRFPGLADPYDWTWFPE